MAEDSVGTPDELVGTESTAETIKNVEDEAAHQSLELIKEQKPNAEEADHEHVQTEKVQKEVDRAEETEDQASGGDQVEWQCYDKSTEETIWDILGTDDIMSNKDLADQHKKAGIKFFNEGKCDDAIEEYTMAISIDSENHVLHSNRSLAHAKKGNHEASLFDAEEVIRLRPNWAKGYIRKGLALKSLGRGNEAIEILEAGLRVDSDDEELKTTLRDCEMDIQNRSKSPPISVQNETEKSGIGGEDMDLATLLAIAQSMHENGEDLSKMPDLAALFGGKTKATAQDEPSMPDIDKSKIGLAEESKSKPPTLTISDPKAEMGGWERLIGNPKTRPPKRDYAEPKAKLSGPKSDLFDPKGTYSGFKTRDKPNRKNSESDTSSPRGRFLDPEPKYSKPDTAESKFSQKSENLETESLTTEVKSSFKDPKSSSSGLKGSYTESSGVELASSFKEPITKYVKPEGGPETKPVASPTGPKEKNSGFKNRDSDPDTDDNTGKEQSQAGPTSNFNSQGRDAKPQSSGEGLRSDRETKQTLDPQSKDGKDKPVLKSDFEKIKSFFDKVQNTQELKKSDFGFKTTDPDMKTSVTKINEPETKLTESKPDFNNPKPKITDPEPKITALETEFNNLLEIDNRKKDADIPPIIGELKVVDKDKAKKEKDLGTECSKRNKFEKAHEHYDKAITFDPTDVSLYSNKALVYTKQKIPLKVRELSMMVVAIILKYGGDKKIVAKSHSRIAKTYLEEENYATALEYFQKAKELNPCTATSDQIRICKKKIYQQGIIYEDEGEVIQTPETEDKHEFLVEERSRCLANESKFYEAISVFENLESAATNDLGMKLLTAECYIQLGRESKAQKAIKKVEKILMKPPMCDVQDVIALANDFTGNCTPVRALLLLRIAGDMLKQSTISPDEIVKGIFRCIAKMNEPVRALLEFKKKEATSKLDEMEEMQRRIQEQFPQPLQAIGMGEEKYLGIDPPKIMDTRKRTKRVVINERSRVIAIDYGVEVMEEMLDDLRAVEDADPEIIALKQAILCNMINNNYSKTGQHGKALKLLTLGLNHFQKHFRENVNQHQIYITLLTNIGAEYHNSEKYYEAEKMELKALNEIDYVLDFDNEEERRVEIKRIRDAMKITRDHIKLA